MAMDLVAPIVSKSSDELRIVSGPVLVPGEKDRDGDVVTKDEIREYAYDYMEKYRIVDANHSVQKVASPVESWLTREPKTVKSVDDVELDLPPGTWMMTARIEDDNEWQAVKNGEYTGFSIMAVKASAKDAAPKSMLFTREGLAIKSKNGRTTLADLEHDVFVPAVSLASNPAVPKSKYVAVKNKDYAIQNGLLAVGKAVPEVPDRPIASEDRSWDRDEAVGAGGRVREYITEEGQEGHEDWGEDQWSTFRSVHLWYNEEDPQNIGSYSLPYQDVVDGELHIIPAAVTTIAGVLEGAMGGADIPEDDIETIRSRVETLYERIAEEHDREDLEVPWAEKSANISLDASTKVGRTISEANLQKLQRVVDNIEAAAEQVEDLIDTARAERRDDDEEEGVNITFREVSSDMDGEELEAILKNVQETTEELNDRVESVKEDIDSDEELVAEMEELKEEVEEVREMAEKSEDEEEEVEEDVEELRESMKELGDTVETLREALVTGKNIDGQEGPAEKSTSEKSRESYSKMGRDAFGRRKRK